MKNRGDDATENVNFQRRKQRLQGPKNFAAELGGDASENGDFQSEKQRLQGYKFFQELSFHILTKNRGTMRQKMAIFKEETAFSGTQKLNF